MTLLWTPAGQCAPTAPDTAPLSFTDGGWWDYEVTRGTITAQNRTKTGDLEDFDGRPAFYFESEEGASLLRTYYSTSTEGAALAGIQTTASGAMGSRNRTIFTPPALAYPKKWKKGHKWTTATEGNGVSDLIGSGSSALKLKIEGKHKIARKEKIKVPAGEFECWLIETEASGSTVWESGPYGGSRHETRGVEKIWFSPALGQVVKSETRGQSTFRDPYGGISPSEERVDRVLVDFSGRVGEKE